ncbi:MAG TPA: hypothetical protein VHT00_14115 [Stellaceae bacterium]|jgi:hypothetical protein|nr:hypothetical protein [Stellaceae bacterium]
MNRQCGDCQLCCKLLPVKELQKAAGQRCRHQKHHKGCAIYPHRPQACAEWSCRWLTDSDTTALARPDRAGYVIDMLPDEIAVTPDGGERKVYLALQIWVDGDGWKDDEALTRYILKKAHEGIPTLIRYDKRRSVGILAPPLSSDGKWQFAAGEVNESMGLWR